MPSVSAPEGRDCLFCGASLGPSTTSSHIIARSVGGGLETKEVTCSACNKYFGDHLEPEWVKRHLATRMNLDPLLKSGLGVREGVITETRAGEVFRLMPGGEPSMLKPRVDKDPETGRPVLNPETGRPKSVRAAFDQLDRAGRILGGDPSKHTFEYYQEPGEDYVVNASGYCPAFLQLTAKALLEYLDLGRLRGGSLPSVRVAEFEGVRRFARYGTPHELNSLAEVHAYPHRAAFFSNALLKLGAPEVNFGHGLVAVFDPAAGLVWGCLSLYSSDLWAIRLAEGYSGPPLTVAYQRAIIRGEEDWRCVSDGVALDFDEDFYSLRADAPMEKRRVETASRFVLVRTDQGMYQRHSTGRSRAEYMYASGELRAAGVGPAWQAAGRGRRGMM